MYREPSGPNFTSIGRSNCGRPMPPWLLAGPSFTLLTKSVTVWRPRSTRTTLNPTKGPVGFKVVRVDLGRQTVTDFVSNVKDGPASSQGGIGRPQLERPIDVKFGPDGSLYILDFGQDRVEDGSHRVAARTGRIFR